MRPLWANASELREIVGEINASQLGFTDDDEVDGFLYDLLERAQGHVRGYLGRDYRYYDVPSAVKEATLRLAANMYNYALKVRRGPLVQTGTFEVELVDDMVFTRALKKDLEPYRIWRHIPREYCAQTPKVTESVPTPRSALYEKNIDRAGAFLEDRYNADLSLVSESNEGTRAVATGANLLANADVDTGYDSPDNWSASVAGAATSTTARSGSRSLRLNVAQATADWRSDPVAVEAGEVYLFGGYIKGMATGEQFFITIRFFDNADMFISEVNVAAGGTYAVWTEKGAQATAPVGAVTADLLFRVAEDDTGDMLGDDFFVKKGRIWNLADTYWLGNDNYLAKLALMPYSAVIANAIAAELTVRGFTGNDRFEVLEGTLLPLTPWSGSNVVVEEGADFIVMNETRTGGVIGGWRDYADLALVQSLNLWSAGETEEARNLFKHVLAMWDGRGIMDTAAEADEQYTAYKLALLLIVAQVVGLTFDDFHAVEQMMWSHQGSGGGIHTEMDFELNVGGFANTETTALAILVYDSTLLPALRGE